MLHVKKTIIKNNYLTIKQNYQIVAILFLKISLVTGIERKMLLMDFIPDRLTLILFSPNI